MPTVALVVGGGIVGLSCALNLQLRGIRTTVIDPATTPRSASWGNAGHLAAEQVEPLANELIARFTRGEIASAHVAYMRFISAGQQRPEVVQLLPLVGALKKDEDEATASATPSSGTSSSS